MNFKLIAIRPLNGCDTSILKGLVPNCIYQLYNEYQFYYKVDEKLESYIEYQRQNLDYESNAKHSALKYEAISAVKRTEQVPKSLYSQNINISAIVGQNGSGKSSLLELFYYLMYKYGTERKLILSERDEKSNRKLEVEVFYEDQNYNVIMHRYSENEDSLRTYNVKKGDLFYLSDENTSDLLSYQCYSIALNYSIYGLNSKVSGNWLESLFHNNNGYRTPITINPFRSNGNIDINNEYILAQSRLLLNYYLVDNQTLMEDVQISNVKFQLDIMKHQYVSRYDERDKQSKLSSISEIYGKLIRYNAFLYDKLTSDIELNFLIEKVLQNNVLIDYKNDRFVYEAPNEKLSDSIQALFKNSKVRDAEFKVLNSLYILKKIYKITQNYHEYEIFKELFFLNEYQDLSGMYRKTIQIRRREIIKIYSDYFYRIYRTLIEEYFVMQKKDFNDFLLLDKEEKEQLRKYLQQTEFGLFKKLGIRSLGNFYGYFDLIFNGYFDIGGSGFLDIGETYFKNNEIVGYIASMIISNLENNDYYSLREVIHMAVDYFLSKNMPDSTTKLNINELNNLLFLKLYSDESHVTFKLKQAISYFKGGFFESIESYRWDQYLGVFDIKLNQSYLRHRSIKTMPLAFVQPVVMVVKTKETDEVKVRRLISDKKLEEYPFNQLSSGEQQLIHSILTVVYHLYNLKSIDDHLYKQTYINLIFDEIELYFHPEYQRIYISNLLQALERIDVNKNLSFNILLSTHSPFILSDIPSQNVLRLKNGVPLVEEDGKNSFGANIHDLLADEFYLEKGFMGEFVNNEINNVAKFLEKIADKKNTLSTVREDFPKYDRQYCEKVINLIGEPILYLSLMELYTKAYKEESKKMIRSQIDKLQQLLRNEDNTH